MRLNQTQPVLDYELKPLFVNKTNEDGSAVMGNDGRPQQEPEILRSSSYRSTTRPGPRPSPAEPTRTPGGTSRRPSLYGGNEVELTSKEVVLLQERIAAIYDSPLIVGRITDMLE